MRYLIRANPNDGEQALGAGAPARVRLAASTTPDELRSLVDDGHRLRDIAHRHDVGRQTVRDELVAHGIPIPPKNPPAHRIERDWLHEQYVIKQRTMPDIAAETGASAGTIWRLIHEYEIPARGRGAPSHQQSLTAGDGYPDPLARAVLRPGGHERVKRFQVYARTRSLNVAATRLGVHQATLTTQLTMLENACEGPLLDRLTRDQRPQQLTELGRVLLDQADRHLGPHPDAPPELPEPLASVLAAHWGDKILTTFTAATAFSTLNDAGRRPQHPSIQPASHHPQRRDSRRRTRPHRPQSEPRRCASRRSGGCCWAKRSSAMLRRPRHVRSARRNRLRSVADVDVGQRIRRRGGHVRADGHYARKMPTVSDGSSRPIETDDVIVLLLGAPGGSDQRGHLDGVTRLEKLVFLLEHETPARSWVTEVADFRSHKFGPFSAKIYKAADTLWSYGLLRDSARLSDSTEDRWEALNVVGVEPDPYTTRTFELTERGLKYYAVLIRELPKDAEQVLSRFKDRFASLPLRQLVRYVYERYPEFTDKSEIRDQILR